MRLKLVFNYDGHVVEVVDVLRYERFWRGTWVTVLTHNWYAREMVVPASRLRVVRA